MDDDVAPRRPGHAAPPGHRAGTPRPVTAGCSWPRLAEWDGQCDVASYGCAAYMSIEIALERAIFDDELGPLARDYVGTTVAWQALDRCPRRGHRARGGTWPERDAASTERRAASDLGGASTRPARTCARRSATRTTGHGATLHQVTFRESTLGSSGILPLELVLQHPAARRSRAPTARSTTTTTDVAGVPGPRRPDIDRRRHRRALRRHERAVVPAARSTWATSTAPGSSSRPARAATRSTPTTAT